jgi:hypothetical protein
VNNNVDAKKLVMKVLSWLAVVVVLYGLYRFEVVNYVTTYDALSAIFGEVTWVVTLSGAIVLVDFAGLAKIFTKETGEKEPPWVNTLMGVWFLVSLTDMTLTWYTTALAMENADVRIPQAIAEHQAWIPIIISVLLWSVHYGIIRFSGIFLDYKLHGSSGNYGKKPSNTSPFANFGKPQAQQQRQKSSGGSVVPFPPVPKSNSGSGVNPYEL